MTFSVHQLEALINIYYVSLEQVTFDFSSNAATTIRNSTILLCSHA